MQLGLALSQKNDTARAANVFREMVRRDPNFREAHNNLGLLLLQAGNPRGAQKEFVDAVRLKPNYAEAHYNLALAFDQEGNKAGSQSEFEKAYAIAPGLRGASAKRQSMTGSSSIVGKRKRRTVVGGLGNRTSPADRAIAQRRNSPGYAAYRSKMFFTNA